MFSSPNMKLSSLSPPEWKTWAKSIIRTETLFDKVEDFIFPSKKSLTAFASYAMRAELAKILYFRCFLKVDRMERSCWTTLLTSSGTILSTYYYVLRFAATLWKVVIQIIDVIFTKLKKYNWVKNCIGGNLFKRISNIFEKSYL